MKHLNSIVVGTGNAGLRTARGWQRSSTQILERHCIAGGCTAFFGCEVFERLGVMNSVELVEDQALYMMIAPSEFDIALPAIGLE